MWHFSRLSVKEMSFCNVERPFEKVFSSIKQSETDLGMPFCSVHMMVLGDGMFYSDGSTDTYSDVLFLDW